MNGKSARVTGVFDILRNPARSLVRPYKTLLSGTREKIHIIDPDGYFDGFPPKSMPTLVSASPPSAHVEAKEHLFSTSGCRFVGSLYDASAPETMAKQKTVWLP
jgi:hypothetical protein